MAVTPAISASQATRLGCGRDVDDVWGTIDRPPDAHEQSCPYCTQARAELAVLAAATNDLRASDQQDQKLRVPNHILTNVLAIVRTEVRRGRPIPLQRRVPAVTGADAPTHSQNPPASKDGNDTAAAKTRLDAAVDLPDLTVSELVIATVVREICDWNPAVEIRRVRIDATPAPTTCTRDSPSRWADRGGVPQPGAVEPADVSMDLQATVSRTAAIPTLITGLRTAIREAVATRIGVSVSRIDVEVQDLFDA